MTKILKDFQTGDDGETLVKTTLETLGYKCEFNEDKKKKKDFDLILIELDKTIEVKNDIYSKKSGNIAIEYNNCKSNTPSGLTATKADFWCHIINGEAYIVKTKKLKTFIKKTKPKRIISAGGDGNADLYLYNIDDIISIFIPLTNIQDIL